ncbi:MAG: MFS transporter [Alistipes sp.]|nr:MFS transporter [Alistipes sp.]
MTETLRRKISSSPVARWTVLALVSLTMLTGYIITDIMAPLKTMLEQQNGWNSAEYGIFTSGYGLFNIFLVMLIIGGIILDKIGPRFTGLLAVVLMIIGTAVKYWAISSDFGSGVVSLTLFGKQLFALKSQVFFATFGFAIFGVGIEMIGITATKIVVKWFTGHSLALAMGLNVAAGRIGTAISTGFALPVAKYFGNPYQPLLLCLLALCIGLMAYLVFVMMDARADKERAIERSALPESSASEEEKFRIADIWSIFRLRGFWYITLLCLLFYSAVFPFLKYATELMIMKFGVSSAWAGSILSLIPIGNMIMTPIFGSIYDHKGRGATIMMIGALLLVFVHLLFAVPALNAAWMAVVLMLLLGAAFSLVPSAMWASVPKIISFNKLGTAYSLIFYIQNIGLSGVPLLIGFVLDRYCRRGEIMVDGVMTTNYDYTIPMLIFALFGIMSVVFAWLLKKEDARKGYGLEKPNIES